MGSIFFFIYMLFVSFILINFFLTIINESFSVVKETWDSEKNKYEILDYCKKSLSGWFGCLEQKDRNLNMDTRFALHFR